MASRVQIVNSVRNGSDWLRRKDADYYVRTGRAIWVADTQIRLTAHHPKNIEAGAAAAFGYDTVPYAFHWSGGDSGGAVVMKTQKGPLSRVVR
jgi:hypothetical protein